MTTYGAYNAGLPCKNPSCKSHGKPHPNCRCYGEGRIHSMTESTFKYAEGGEVESYCSSGRAHNRECEYFADGGPVEIPQDQVIMDKPAAKSEIPHDQVVMDEIPSDQVSDIKPPELPKKKSVLGYEITPYRFEKEKKAEDFAKPVLAGYEGAGRGFAGPVGTAIEAGLAKADPFGIGMFEQLSPEKQKERAQLYPEEASTGELAGLGLGIATGGGTIGAADKLAKAASTFNGLGRTGSAIVKGLISNGMIEASDEVAQGILNKGNPEHHVGAALAHVGAAGVIGGLLGGFASKAAQGLEKLAETKVGDKISTFMAGFASAAKHPEADRAIVDHDIKHYLENTPGLAANYKDYLSGIKAYDDSLNAIAKKASSTVGAGIAQYTGESPLVGWFLGDALSKYVEKPVKAIAGKLSPQYVAPAVMQAIAAGGKEGLLEALGHAGSIEAGQKAIAKGVDRLFQTGIQVPQKIYNYEKSRKKLDDWIERGGVDGEIQEQIYDNAATQGFAEGGPVQGVMSKKPGLESVYPDQAMLMNTAKARISNYLTGLRPQNTVMKLPFDPNPDTRRQKKVYQKALDVAANPMSIMDDIHKGTIEADSIKHLRMMHPEVLGLLQSKATQRITQAQLKGERPSYKVQQGLSMLLGTPLSSVLTPQSIQAAQGVFAAKAQAKQGAQQPQGQVKKGTSTLTNSDRSFLTGPQARVSRQQRAR